MTVDLVVKNGKIVSTEGIFSGGVAIDEGKIVSVSSNSCLLDADKTIDAGENYIFPGIIDPHVHLGIYQGAADGTGEGVEQGARTESIAAAHGGVTAMSHFIAVERSYNEVIPEVQATIEANSMIDVAVIGILHNMNQVEEIEEYVKKGVTSYKHFLNRPELAKYLMHPDDGQLLYIWKKLRDVGGLPMAHCENFEIIQPIAESIKSSGKETYPGIWNDCRPWLSEYESMQRVALITKMARSRAYVVHMSIGAGVDICAKAWNEGVEMYLETCPHYLTLRANDPKLKVLEKINPPLRTQEDIERLWQGIRMGYIQTIGTDHCASKLENKMGNGDIWSALPAFPGVETMFPIVLTEGLRRGLSLEKIVAVCSTNAASIHGLQGKGSIKVGNDGDLVIVDMNRRDKVTLDNQHGYSDYTMYEGMELIWPKMTISKGKIIVEDGETVGKPGTGKMIKSVPRTS